LLNILGIFVLVVLVIFLLLGVFVIVGLRKEVKQIISLIFEGSVKYIDLVHALRSLWGSFIKIIQEIIIIISPLIAIFLAIVIYYAVMFLFHLVARNSDIAIFTVFITIVLACVNAILGISRSKEIDEKSFKGRLSLSFGRTFVDSIEVVTMVLFLTLDMKNPFFLPKYLHTPISAKMFGLDLMQRSITADNMKATLIIAGTAVMIEIFRKIYRIVAAAALRYKELRSRIPTDNLDATGPNSPFSILQQAIRMSFKDNLDDLTKFIGFTTILIIAFFFFPRLKLVSLIFYNATNLIWDIMYPQRTILKAKYDDLVSRILAKVFKL
jgi:hypothetical protein